jgi:hypothetical protein
MKLRIVLPMLLVLLALPVLAGPPMTELTIKVTSVTGKPVAHADVIVRFKGNHSVKRLGRKTPVSWEMRSNQEGVAKIPPIPQGTIEIQVIAKDYQTFGDDFEVNEPTKTLEIKLNPPQRQYSVH